jgi:hypothetical protein
MTNAPSGGDGMPSSPEASQYPWAPPNGPKDDDHSKTNPPGIEKELNLGDTTVLAKKTTTEEINPQATNFGLLPLKEVANEEQKEESEESVTTRAMDIKKNLDSAHHGMSLASNSDDEDATPLSETDCVPEKAAPPCHQSISDSVSDDPKTARDNDLDEIVEETATIMSSVSNIELKEYQMKLLVPKKNAEDYLIGIIR